MVVLVIVYLLFGQMTSKKTAENSEIMPVDTGTHQISDDPLKRPLDQTKAVLDKVRQNANEQP